MKTAERDIPRIIRQVTIIGATINVMLTIVKVVVGYIGHSDALVADGVHSLSDLVSDIIVVAFVAVAYQKADDNHPYGHGKFETLATLIISVALLAVGIALAIGGVTNIIGIAHGKILPIPSFWTVMVALISILSKEWLFRYTRKVGKNIRSSSLEANAWHHRTDALSSIATLVGCSAGYFLGQKWCILDPIVTILIAGFIAMSAFQIAMPSIGELLEKSPDKKTMDEIGEIVDSVNGVISYHQLRARHNGGRLIVDVHIKVAGTLSVYEGHDIASAVEQSLRQKFGPESISYIHIEPFPKR